MAGLADILGGVSSNAPEPPIPPEVMKSRRAALAAALAKSGQPQQGMTHWAQALAQGVNAAGDAYAARQLAEQEARSVAAANAVFGSADQRMQAIRPAAAPAGSFGFSGPTSGPTPTRTSSAVAPTGPLVTTDADTDKVVRTVYGEASGEGAIGQQAVAAVIKNRALQSGMSPTDVVLAKNQFEPWGSRRGELERLDPASPKYQQILANIQPILTGDAPDPTGGATHFYAPKAQAAMGRKAPSWDDGSGVDLGNHRFFNLGYGKGGPHGTGTRSADAGGAISGDVGQPTMMGGPGADTLAQPQPRPYDPEFPSQRIAMAANSDPDGPMVPVPPSRPSQDALVAALANGPVPAPSVNDATVAALAPGDAPAPNMALVQALDPSSLGTDAGTDAAATFSPQLMAPPQTFDPGPAVSPMAITVSPSAPAVPVPQQVAQVVNAPAVDQPFVPGVGDAPPLPPARPTDLAALDPRADMPAPGAQETVLTQAGPVAPQQGSPPGYGLAGLPGAPMLVSNPMNGPDLSNSNDAGARAFAADASNRAPAAAQAGGFVVPPGGPATTGAIPPVSQPAAPGAGATPAGGAPGAPMPISPPAQQAAQQGAPAQQSQPDVAAARAGWLAVLGDPYQPKARQDYARDQLKALDERGAFTQYKDDTGATWQRDQRTGQTSVIKDGTKYQTFQGADGNTYAWNPERPNSAPTPLGPSAGARQLTDPADRAQHGVPQDFKGSVQVLPNGKLEYPGEQTTDQKNYNSAVAGGYTGTFNQFVQQHSQRQGQAVTVKDANGNERTMFYDPVENRLKSPEEMGAPPAQAPSNPYAPGGKSTEEQAKNTGYANRMVEGHNIITQLEGTATNGVQKALSQVPGAGNYLITPERQKLEQAQRDFVNSVLRRESGAAISPDEFKNAERQYFPQPGDSPAVIEQKRINRDTTIAGVMAGAGTGYKPPDSYKPVPRPTDPGSAATAAPAMPTVASPADAAKLPSGTRFKTPDGRVRMVP